MTDRELLEMAAKAAGIEVRWTESDVYRGSFLRRVDPAPSPPFSEWLYWRPLTDDGDALRLAVKLRLDISARDDDVEVLSWSGSPSQVIEADNGDRTACTRRAIVRAAAEIGKAMP